MLLEILRVKIRHYVGGIGGSWTRTLSPVFFYFGWLFVIASVSLLLRLYNITVGANLEDFVKALKPLAVSTVVAVGIFLGVKGGITALSYEVEYIFTSPVKPRTYLLADLLFQFLFLNLFTVPAAVTMVTVITFPRHIANLQQLLPILEASIVSSILLGHILGLMRNWVGRKYLFIIGFILILLVTFPLLDLFFEAFSGLVNTMPPVNILLNVTSGGVYSAAAILYFTSLAIVYGVLVNRVSYAGLAPILTHVLTDPPRKIINILKTPKGLGSFFALSSEEGPASMMLKIHLTRFIRDGSLWITAFVLVLLVYVNSFLPQALNIIAAPEASLITIVSLYTPLIPALLSINWILSERNNVWLIQLSVYKVKTYMVTLLFSYILVSVIFSAILLSIVNLVTGFVSVTYMDVLLLVCSAVFGSFFALLVSTSVKRLPSPFSMTSVFLVIVPLLGSQFLSLPVYVARVFEPFATSPPPLLPFILFSYVAATAYSIVALSKLTANKMLQ